MAMFFLFLTGLMKLKESESKIHTAEEIQHKQDQIIDQAKVIFSRALNHLKVLQELKNNC